VEIGGKNAQGKTQGAELQTVNRELYTLRNNSILRIHMNDDGL
jgi:hypothetical protein